MSRYNVLRLGKFTTFLVLMLLWASAAPIDARIEHDNGIVRVKSAVYPTKAAGWSLCRHSSNGVPWP